ncbi:MAG: guanylate kinase [Candidatus Kaelpia aquatica]|nr:guanylate kinase [Candidatus Kaelpia aquatica]
MNRKAKLFIISGPSGAGKTTIARKLFQEVEGLARSISCTTRERREAERDGIDYRFINSGRFQNLIKENAFLEWAIILKNYYGTLKDDVEAQIAGGNDVLLCIDVQGAAQVLKKKSDTVAIFVMPPDIEELRARLLKRGESKKEIEKRIGLASKEIKRAPHYHHVVYNGVLHQAVDLVKSIVYAERQK